MVVKHLESPWQLRPLQLSDLDAVMAIERLSLPIPTKESVYRYELTENQVAHYYALLNGRFLVGYAGYWVLGDEMHISIIAIHPDWRRQGLGAWLLLALLAIACERQMAACTLEVRRSNRVAQSLYQKYGFKIVGERRRYYKDKEDALIMTLVLSTDAACPELEVKQVTLLAQLIHQDQER